MVQTSFTALWNITKHANDLHVSNLFDWCGVNQDKNTEIDLHHNVNSARHEITPELSQLNQINRKSLLI